jgi:hypothetical protein
MPNAKLSAKSNYDVSTLINGHLYWALIGATKYHVATIREAKVELQEPKVLESNSELELLVSCLSCDVHRTISERQGDWTVVNGIAFGHQKHQTHGSKV